MRPRYSDSLVRIVHEAVARKDLHKLNEISEYAECKESTARIILNRLIVRDFLRLEENGDYFAENKMLNMSLMDIDSFNPIRNIFGEYLGIRSFPYCFFTTCFYRIFTEENPFNKKYSNYTEALKHLKTAHPNDIFPGGLSRNLIEAIYTQLMLNEKFSHPDETLEHLSDLDVPLNIIKKTISFPSN